MWYVDGAVVRNNPVRLAHSEATKIWRSSKPPDIVISIGTGILVDENGQVSREENLSGINLRWLLPQGIRTRVEVGLDMIRSTLNCHREWTDFQNTLVGSLSKNSHRLDVGLSSKPPPLDAVGTLFTLQDECEIYLKPGEREQRYFDDRYTSADHHIRVVACRLLASLFYLQVRLHSDMAPGRLRSAIYCRLPPQSEGAKALIALEPKFRLRETRGNARDIIKAVNHVNTTGFNRQSLASQVTFELSEGQFERSIEVQFPSRGPHWEPIGGF